jgi:hypothetical protein
MANTLTETQRVQVVAGLAGADRRTVQKYLDGGHVRGRVLRERLEMAARQLAALEGTPAQPTRG